MISSVISPSYHLTISTPYHLTISTPYHLNTPTPQHNIMDYTLIKRRYMRFLRLERNYTQNTIDAYSHDIDYLINFLNGEHLAIEEVRLSHLEQFATILHEFGVAPSSQARILCGVRSFFRFLLLDGTLKDDPSELLESPTLGEHLPQVLSTEEIDRMEQSIDLSKPEGQRNRAIIEMLFSCGLRVSELVNLKFCDVSPQTATCASRARATSNASCPYLPTPCTNCNCGSTTATS